jgi:hypothetical protein
MSDNSKLDEVLELVGSFIPYTYKKIRGDHKKYVGLGEVEIHLR